MSSASSTIVIPRMLRTILAVIRSAARVGRCVAVSIGAGKFRRCQRDRHDPTEEANEEATEEAGEEATVEAGEEATEEVHQTCPPQVV